jgi:ribonuclease HI
MTMQTIKPSATGHVTSRDVTRYGPLPRSDSRAVPSGLVIYADGACEPNPGAGGWGFVAYRDGIEVHAERGGDTATTNQRMELTAALRALRWIGANVGSDVANVGDPIRLISDSAYTVNGCNDWRHGWKRNGWQRGGPNAKPENRIVANVELWRELDAALTATPVTLEWCKGHAGIIGNERADELSLIGRDRSLEALAEADQITQQLRMRA